MTGFTHGHQVMAAILVLHAKVPFTSGGAEALVGSLVKELRARKHTVDTIEIPFAVEPKEGIPSQVALWRALDLTRFAGQKVDLVIGTKFPSYFARHPKKSVWLVHQHRPMYDLHGSRYSDFSDDPRDEALRRMLMEADTKALAECQFRAGISQNVSNRLRTFNGLDSVALYPPLPLGGRYRSGPFEDYILSVGRICSIKRVDLMLKGMPVVHPFVKLKIAGVPDESGVMDYLKNEIDKHHLWDRVEFLGRVTDEQLVELYARALAVYYAPHNEDYGYVTLEAMASGKPVLTAVDSGGVLEFVRHGETGLVVDPTSDALGHAANSLVEDRAFAERLGAAGREFIVQRGLAEQGWEPVIAGLLSPLG